MFHIAGGVTMVPAPWRTCTSPFSCRIFTASRTTVRLTEKVSQSAGSGGSGVPGRVDSADDALHQLGRDRRWRGWPAAAPTPGAPERSAADCGAAVMSPSGGSPCHGRRPVYGDPLTSYVIDVHTSYELRSASTSTAGQPATSWRVSSDEAANTVVGRPGCGRWPWPAAEAPPTRTPRPAVASGKLVVWDWKSGDATAAAYVEKAKADFAKKHPGVTVEFVAQPFDQYYTLLGAAIQAGKGPDVMLFNGGGQIRDRADALLPLDEYVGRGQAAAGRLGRVHQGRQDLRRAGDAAGPPDLLQQDALPEGRPRPGRARPRPGTSSSPTAPPSPRRPAPGASPWATRRASASSSSCRAWARASSPPQEYDDWIAGKRDWNSPERQADLRSSGRRPTTQGLNNDGANSTAMFNDAFAHLPVRQGRQRHRSDVGRRALEGLQRVPRRRQRRRDEGAGRHRRRHAEPRRTTAASATAVAKWTKDPKLAADLVRSLTSTDALKAFYADAGAIASDTTDRRRRAAARPSPRSSSRDQDRQARPARGAVVQDPGPDGAAVPAAARADRSRVDEAVKQLAASDQAG